MSPTERTAPPEALRDGQGHRLLIVSDNYPPDVAGGISHVTLHLARSLPPADVVVLAPLGPRSADFDAGQAFRTFRAPFRTDRKLSTVVSAFRFAWQALRISRREHCHLLYLSKPWPLGIVGLMMRAFGKPYIVHSHGSDIVRRRGRLNTALCRHVLRRAARVVVNSHFTLSHALAMGAVPCKTVIVHPKIDPSRFEEPWDAQDFAEREGLVGKFVLLTVGRLVNPRKGVDRVIETLPQVVSAFPKLMYVVVGEGADRPRLEKLAASLGVAEHVRFVGNRDAVPFFRCCDIFIMVSRPIESQGDVESFGIVYLEANACRKPVIAGDTGGVADAVEDGVSGLLVNPDDLDAIEAALLRLLGDKELCRRLGEDGYQRVLRRFTTDRYSSEFRELVLSAMADEAPG